MTRLIFVWLALMTLACSLSAEPPTPTPPPPTPIPPTVFIDGRDQPDTNATAVPATNTPAPTLTACTPRADWPTYVIQPGETLSELAVRTSSTTEALVAANCLANPNSIFAGQTLRVPRAPIARLPATATLTRTPTITPSPTATTPVTVSCPPLFSSISTPVTIYPYVSVTGSCHRLQPGQWVTVTWPGAALDFTEVTFYRLNDSLPRADVIGVDNTPADGASISWQVPTTMQPSLIYAASITAAQGSQVDSGPIGIVLSQ